MNLNYIGKNLLRHTLELKKGNVSGSISSTGSFGHIRMNGKNLPKLNETGSSILIGNGAGAVEDGSATRGNIFIGFEAGNDNTSGHSNVAICLLYTSPSPRDS